MESLDEIYNFILYVIKWAVTEITKSPLIKAIDNLKAKIALEIAIIAIIAIIVFILIVMIISIIIKTISKIISIIINKNLNDREKEYIKRQNR